MKYYMPKNGETADCAREFATTHDGEWAAEDAARDYHENCDGWEDSWPVVIVVVSDDGKEARYEVEREAVPTFSARAVGGEEKA